MCKPRIAMVNGKGLLFERASLVYALLTLPRITNVNLKGLSFETSSLSYASLTHSF